MCASREDLWMYPHTVYCNIYVRHCNKNANSFLSPGIYTDPTHIFVIFPVSKRDRDKEEQGPMFRGILLYFLRFLRRSEPTTPAIKPKESLKGYTIPR